MRLRIRNVEARGLARELAKLTGESVNVAVTTALRERLARLRGGRRRLAQRLLAIGRDCAKRLPPGVRAIDHGALLYGEHGLPR
jgi:antitoxin VapB